MLSLKHYGTVFSHAIDKVQKVAYEDSDLLTFINAITHFK